jgi:WD40 repeat protein
MLSVLLVAIAADPVPIAPAKLDRTAPVDFAKEIRPILTAKCIACHAGKITEGDYDLSTPAKAIAGGKRGAAIVPGKPGESLALSFSAHRKKPIMPPKSDSNPLTSVEVALLERWIAEGAKGEAAVFRPTIALTKSAVNPVRGVAVDPKKAWLAIARGPTITIHDAKSGALLRTMADGPALVESLVVSPDGTTLAAGGFRRVTIWDTATGSRQHRIDGFSHQITALAFRPDGKRLAVGGGLPSEDGEIAIVDLAAGTVITRFPAPHTDTVYGLAWSPDGTQLASAAADKFVKLWNAETGSPVASFEGHTQHVLDVAWTADGKRLVSAGADGLLKVWDVAKGEKVRDIPGFAKQAMRLARAKETLFVACGDGAVRSINPETGGTNRTFAAATGPVGAVAVSPDGEWLAAGGDDGTVKLFDVKTGKPLREWPK